MSRGKFFILGLDKTKKASTINLQEPNRKMYQNNEDEPQSIPRKKDKKRKPHSDEDEYGEKQINKDFKKKKRSLEEDDDWEDWESFFKK